jgi:gamma-glutamylcyclotransferase
VFRIVISVGSARDELRNPKMNPYFAYGSNMWDAQMSARCPHGKKLGKARLKGYRWIITTRGYANVVASPEHDVEGILFEISESDELRLDVYEGVAVGSYNKAWLPVEMNGQTHTALVYLDPVTEEGQPKEEYISRINASLNDAELSDDYVSSQVRKFLPARAG